MVGVSLARSPAAASAHLDPAPRIPLNKSTLTPVSGQSLIGAGSLIRGSRGRGLTALAQDDEVHGVGVERGAHRQTGGPVLHLLRPARLTARRLVDLPDDRLGAPDICAGAKERRELRLDVLPLGEAVGTLTVHDEFL